MNSEPNETVTRVWAESRSRLRNFIARRVKNDADSDDILQDVFFKIHLNIDKLKDPEKIYPWIFQTTRNAIADHYRSGSPDFGLLDGDTDSFAFEPEESGVEEEVLSWLEPMVNELPAKYRDAVLLADIRGLSQKDVSEKLGISLSGAKSRVQRGRDKLKQNLLDCCRFEFARSGKIVEYRQQKEECAGCSH